MQERIVEPPRLLPRRPIDLVSMSGVLRHGQLIRDLTRREIASRHRGSWLGFVWPLLQPLLLLGVYTFVFSFVFGARWPGIFASDVAGYAVVVFSGLVTFNIFAESVRVCPKLILSNRNFVQRVVFPLEVLPVVPVLAALVQAGVGLVVLVAVLAFSGAGLPASAIWLPFVWAVFAVFTLGVCYLVATVSVFVRDFEPLVAIGITGLFFGSAIFYPLERLPDQAEAWLRLLPTAAAVDLSRRSLLLGESPDPSTIAGPLIVSFGMLLIGHAVFVRVKERFADAL